MNIHLPQIQFPAEIPACLTAKFEEQKKTEISSGMHRAQIDREKINLHKILRALDCIELSNSSANMQACLDNLEKAYNTLSNTSDSFPVYLQKLDKGDLALKDAKFSTRLEVLKAELEAKKTPVKKINELATSVFQRLRDATAQFIPPEQKSLLIFQPASLQKKRFEQETLRGGCPSPCKVASPFFMEGAFLESKGGLAQADSALFFEGRATPDSARLLEGRETPDTARLTCRKEIQVQTEVSLADPFPLVGKTSLNSSVDQTASKGDQKGRDSRSWEQ